jgi:hypothetical protein
LGGRAGADRLDLGGDVDAQIADRGRVEGLLLGLHDARQAGVAGLVEAQVGGEHGRQADLDGLHAAIHFALHGHVGAVDLHLVGEGGLGPAQVLGQELAHLVVVAVHGLLAEDDQIGALLLDQGGQDARHGVGVEVLLVGLDQDRAISAHGEGGAQLLGGIVAADGHDRLTWGLSASSAMRIASSTAISQKGFILKSTAS